MDANLIIDDEYVQDVGRLAAVRGRKLEEILDKYTAILAEIEGEAITHGDVAKALTAYKDCVTLLNDKVTEISSKIETVADSFIVDVNAADDYLF